MSGAESTRDIYAGRPSVCRNCGALVGAGENTCAVCGSPAGFVPPAAAVQQPEREQQQQQQQSLHDKETMRFARAVLTRPATFTFVFLAVNVFIFLLMSFTVPGGTENPETLRVYGAKYNALINQGEWWRLVTPVFLHVGGLHLLVNMYSLFILGPYVEKLYGSAKFVFFWIATGVAGVVASYLSFGAGMQEGALRRFLAHDPSAGASGALFGLIGVLFVFGIKFRHELPEGFKRAFGTGMLPTILINLFIGFAIPFIDNAAHMGGFIAGAVFALFVNYKRPGERAGVAVFWHILQFAALALVIVGFGQVARHMGAAPRALGSYIEAINEGQLAFPAALNGRDAAAANNAIEKIDRATPLAPQPDQILRELKALLVRAHDFALLGDDARKDKRMQEQLKQLVIDFNAWEERSDAWVEAEGRQYGIALDKKEEASPTPTVAPAATVTPSPND